MRSAATIRGLPTDQRPRERLAMLGAPSLSDAELLAILLGTGRAGVNAVDLATTVLGTYGGLAGLRQADMVTLAREPGIGAAKAARLVAALALTTRVDGGPDRRFVIASSSDVVAVTTARLAAERREVVLLVVCGPANRVLDVVTLAVGAAHSAAFPVREVLAEVLRRDGIAFALAHNHPGGDATPSAADLRATSLLAEAAERVGLRLLDHVIVAGTRWRSVLAGS